MLEVPLTKGKIAIIDDADSDLLNFDWYAKEAKRTFYARRGWSKKRLVMHRIILGRMLGHELSPSQLVDHINGNGLDNRRCNLRLSTMRGQVGNTRKRISTTTSKYKGVHWRADRNRWRVEVGRSPRTYVGLFKSEIDAARAYDEAARKYFGEYARCNFND